VAATIDALPRDDRSRHETRPTATRIDYRCARAIGVRRPTPPPVARRATTPARWPAGYPDLGCRRPLSPCAPPRLDAAHPSVAGIVRFSGLRSSNRVHDYWRPLPRNARLPSEAYRQQNRPCFITIRARSGSAPFQNAALNDAVIAALLPARERANCDLYAYCLMPDHLHVVAAPRFDGQCVLRFVAAFKSLSTHTAWRCGRRGALWQPRFYDHIIRDEQSFGWVCQYTLDNPVRAGLIAEDDAYRWRGEPDPLRW
jgi:putative transposase